VSPRRALPLLLAAAVVAVLVARVGVGDDRGSSSEVVPSGTVRVARVVDGDTIKVRLASGRLETVRYIGIDTPESVKPDTPVQCYAERASQENAALVDGREVRLVGDREARDRYGRLLAYVYRQTDGAFVNARLVAGGFARTLEIAPNTRYAGRFAALARQARAAGRGLWGAC
jgi:micrococcal nuclease